MTHLVFRGTMCPRRNGRNYSRLSALMPDIAHIGSQEDGDVTWYAGRASGFFSMMQVKIGGVGLESRATCRSESRVVLILKYFMILVKSMR